MKKTSGYVYSAEGHLYVLVPEFTVGLNRIHIVGAGIYSMKMEYLGYWDNFNMPKNLIGSLLKWVKLEREGEILQRRTALMKQARAIRH